MMIAGISSTLSASSHVALPVVRTNSAKWIRTLSMTVYSEYSGRGLYCVAMIMCSVCTFKGAHGNYKYGLVFHGSDILVDCKDYKS